jgi:hypothetical protein
MQNRQLCFNKIGRTSDEKELKKKGRVQMVVCPNCGQQVENEKFCSNCGAQLNQQGQVQQNNPYQAPSQEQNQPPFQGQQQPYQGQQQAPYQGQYQAPYPGQNQGYQQAAPNPNVEKLKETSRGFGKYALQVLKQPSSAKSLDDQHLISGIISIVVYSFVYALFYYLEWVVDFDNVDFVDFFLKPFLVQLILLAAIVGLVFVALMVVKENQSIQSVISKFGAYIIPFLLIYVLGSLFYIIDVPKIGWILDTVAKYGVMLLVPALLLLENKTNSKLGLDRLYVIIIVFALVLLVNDLVSNIYSDEIPSDNISFEDFLEEFY